MKIKDYKKIVEKNKKQENVIKDCLLAFISGGVFGVIGQGLIDLYCNVLGLNNDESRALTSITIVFITAFLTLIKIYKKIGKHLGAGLFVPISGFANSSCCASIEGRYEGFVGGLGSNIFSLAGSVITFGVSSSLVMLIIKFFMNWIGL